MSRVIGAELITCQATSVPQDRLPVRQLYSPYMDIFSFLIAMWLTQAAPQVLSSQGYVQTSSSHLSPSLNKAPVKYCKSREVRGSQVGNLVYEEASDLSMGINA